MLGNLISRSRWADPMSWPRLNLEFWTCPLWCACEIIASLRLPALPFSQLGWSAVTVTPMWLGYRWGRRLPTDYRKAAHHPVNHMVINHHWLEQSRHTDRLLPSATECFFTVSGKISGHMNSWTMLACGEVDRQFVLMPCSGLFGQADFNYVLQ